MKHREKDTKDELRKARKRVAVLEKIMETYKAKDKKPLPDKEKERLIQDLIRLDSGYIFPKIELDDGCIISCVVGISLDFEPSVEEIYIADMQFISTGKSPANKALADRLNGVISDDDNFRDEIENAIILHDILKPIVDQVNEIDERASRFIDDYDFDYDDIQVEAYNRSRKEPQKPIRAPWSK